MMHLRLITSPDLSARTEQLLESMTTATNIVVLKNVARNPHGDVIMCDVPREVTSELLDELRKLGIAESGSISLEAIDLSLSDRMEKAEEEAPGFATDAVVWEEVESKTNDEAQLSFTFLAFMAVATMIAGIGVLLDQPILIVGAMVVGPDFGPLAALSVGLVRRRRAVVRRALLAIVVGFGVGILITIVFTLLLTAFGVVDAALLTRPHPLTKFIWSPDALSWVIGVLAGIAGMLSLTSAKSGALVGVLISVTTIPAAANVAVALSYGVGNEASGSALQLVINLVAIVLGGTGTLLLQLGWQRFGPERRKTGLAAKGAGEHG